MLYKLKDIDGTPLKDKSKEYELIKVFNFLRNSQGTPILQGASLKGMVRSIYEAMTDSCMALAATSKLSKKSHYTTKEYEYEDIGDYRHNNCDHIERLCPACRMFGTIQGESIHCQGKVVFSDAVMTSGELIKERCFLRELSSPKPRHHATYALQGNVNAVKRIRGRKFYYHQGEAPPFLVEENKEHKSNGRSIVIDEYARVSSEFNFHVRFENLEKDELGKLLLAIELHDGLGHKMGLGKAIGLGSCCISVDVEDSLTTQGSSRYKSLKPKPVEGWYSLKVPPNNIPESLYEVLRLDKIEDVGTIGYPYPPSKAYPSAPIDALGVFGGTAKTGKKPPWPDEVAAGEPPEPAPVVKPDEEAAWMKEIHTDKLILINKEGEVRERSRKSYQSSPKLLEVGKWFILSGTKCVKRAPQ
jgi:CRISPR/Cas system CSM-associated protein Csm3 (group 7 of RAMP superfamily)